MAGTVIDEGGVAEVEVEFEAGDMSGIGTSLELCTSDGESVLVNGVELEVTETYDGHFKYRAEVDPAPSYTFEMVLGSDQQSMEVTLDAPPDFQVEMPAPGSDVSRNEEVELVWTNPDMGMQLEIELIDDEILCLEDWGVTTMDDGSHPIPAGAVVLADEDAPDGKCQAEYLFTRVRSAQTPEALASGGSLDAFVTRGLRFVSVP